MKYERTHGGDWAGFALAHGRPPLDFSANISPLGVPTGVQEALREAAGQADRYPDPLCRDLRAASLLLLALCAATRFLMITCF